MSNYLMSGLSGSHSRHIFDRRSRKQVQRGSLPNSARKRPSTGIAIGGIAAAAILALSACSSSSAGSSGSQTQNLSVVTFPSAFYTLPEFIAQQQGYFKAQGLNVKFITGTSGSAALQLLEAGSVDIVPASPSGVQALNAKPGALQVQPIIGVQSEYFSLVARVGWPTPHANQGVKAALDLKGAKIGISSPGGESDLVTEALMTAVGLNPAKDASFVNLSIGGTSQLAALKSKEVDVLVSNEPTTTTAIDFEHTGKMLLDLRNGGGGPEFTPWMGVTRVALTKDLTKDPAKFQKYDTAIAEALKYMTNPANEAAVDALEAQHVDLAKNILDAVYKNNIDLFSSDLNCSAYANVMNFMVKVEGVKRADVKSCAKFMWSGAAKYLTNNS
jgi:ABC-type nitrate/sulfonate/bicarbonate transport system substrate-binding protein